MEERPQNPKHVPTHEKAPYRITHQEHEEKYAGAGQTEQHVHVHFETPKGNRAKVVIPLTHYTARNIHREVAPLAQEMDKVSEMHGDKEPSEYGQP